MKKLLCLVILLCATATVAAQTLYIYGGREHDVFLGCLNGSKYDSNSIWNEYGQYGNKYNTNSIWNSYGTYGNKYNDLSPWNEYAAYPPVLLDQQGNFYGYFTRNKYKNKRADFKLVTTIYTYYDLIAKDVKAWYDKLFEQN
jgi:hypothetical protein